MIVVRVMSAAILFVAVFTLEKALATLAPIQMTESDAFTKECPSHGTVMPVARGSDKDKLVCPMCHRILGETA